jgi:hypothetical protein
MYHNTSAFSFNNKMQCSKKNGKNEKQWGGGGWGVIQKSEAVNLEVSVLVDLLHFILGIFQRSDFVHAPCVWSQEV